MAQQYVLPSLRGTIAGLAAIGVFTLGTITEPVSVDTQNYKEWRDYAGGPDGSRFIDLKQINKSNVGRLEVAWTYPYGESGFNPIVARGVIYTKARNSSLVALDAVTGKELWIHDGLQGITTRGINYWESRDGRDRRLIFSINDYLQEIDALTGKSIRTFGSNGVVDLREGLGRDPATIRIQSGTPGRVFENLILLGSSTGEGYFAAPGDLRAYDVITGKLVWQFRTVPQPGEFGYETWPKDAWRYIGGTNTWGEITVDAERGIAYFPTGSGTYDFYGADRIGDNLFANCLIALDARTGKRLWHFQTVHHDLWDFDNVAGPQLTTIRRNGRNVDVVALAGKTGYLYVFNRVTGEPIWPIEERPVPTTTEVPGEKLSPTQPIPTMPAPFGKVSFSVDDINPYMLTPEERESFTARVAKARHEGPFTPIGFSEVLHMPGNHGGANWGSTSANPKDGSVYVINFNVPALLRLLRPGEQPAGRGGGGGGGGRAGGRGGAAAGPGLMVYQRDCQSCHGADRAGQASIPSLLGITTRLSAADLRTAIVNGRGQMPPFHQLTAPDLDALMAFLSTPADAGRGRGAGPAGGAGGGRGGGAAMTFPPGPTVESGPAVTRPGGGGGRGGGGPQAYPEGVDAPADRLMADGYGLYPTLTKPPYTTLTAYDLNRGTIKWQIGLGDDLRLASRGITGTGAAEMMKGSVVATASGLLFANTADRKVHVYDSDNGKHLAELSLGAASSGSPSMYEARGRQYLLVTAGNAGGFFAGPTITPDTPPAVGPTGLVAYALKR